MTEPNIDSNHNRKAWNQVAIAKDKYFHECSSEDLQNARTGNVKLKLTPTKNLPTSWLGDLPGREILCLAGGGGQQAPLLAAAGANVTVFDIAEAQLSRDQEIASREGLNLETICGDMSDLSTFGDERFDLIINPTSVCYCPNVSSIWKECFRVLKPGGELIAGAINPNNFLFDARERDNGNLVVRHKIPYSDLQLDEDERIELIGAEHPVHYGHSIADLIGGQIEAGFQITGFFEDRWGDEDALSDLIAVFFCTKALKPPKSG